MNWTKIEELREFVKTLPQYIEEERYENGHTRRREYATPFLMSGDVYLIVHLELFRTGRIGDSRYVLPQRETDGRRRVAFHKTYLGFVGGELVMSRNWHPGCALDVELRLDELRFWADHPVATFGAEEPDWRIGNKGSSHLQIDGNEITTPPSPI